MASVRATPGGKFELTIRHRLLPKRIYLTFDAEAAAREYGDQVDRLLAAGIVPAGLVEDKAKPRETLIYVLKAWVATGQPAKSDISVLDLLMEEVGQVRLDQITYAWTEAWVQEYKLKANLSPGTIRKRVGSLSRCLDWYLRNHPQAMVGNPLKLLPRGAATYNAQDSAQAVALGMVAKVDQERDRRLLPGEFERILAALAGEKRPDRERPLALQQGVALRCLFLLILYTGLRLREAYRLRRGQVDMVGRVITLQTSKQWHGRVKMRTVPMRPQTHAALSTYLDSRDLREGDLLFPWWDGSLDDLALNQVTSRLSTQFGRLFDYAQCPGLTEHDLRHEATCQWFELRDARGEWMFREVEINKIMGWAPGSKMAARYASFRSADLAARLWPAPAAPAESALPADLSA